jgi:hypothetical protein
MKTFPGTLLVAALLFTALPGPAGAQDLTLSINEGRVTLIAQNVPVSRILAEWARIGQSTILNGEKLTGPPVTLHFENQPERDVLEVLLGSASGYIVAPRSVAMANASAFDRILIMPTSRPPAVSAAVPPQFSRPPMQPPVPIQPDIDDDPAEPVMPVGMQPQPNPNMPVMPPGEMNQPAGFPTPGQPTDADDATATRHAGARTGRPGDVPVSSGRQAPWGRWRGKLVPDSSRRLPQEAGPRRPFLLSATPAPSTTKVESQGS